MSFTDLLLKSDPHDGDDHHKKFLILSCLFFAVKFWSFSRDLSQLEKDYACFQCKFPSLCKPH